MQEYSQYTYGSTLRFFEAYYPYDYEPVRYAELMLSMIQCKTIDELIAVRERLKRKIEKIDLSKVYDDKSHQELIDELSKCNSLYYSQLLITEIKDRLRLDVNSCYDENVFRLLKETKTINANVCGECFINLSHCWELSKYKDMIIDVAKNKANIDVSELLDKIAKRYKEFGDHWNKYKGFREGMNGYLPAKQVVEDDFAYLKQFNWRLLPKEKAQYNIIDREEIKRREEELIKRKKKIEEFEKKKKEHEEQLKKYEEKYKKEKEKDENKAFIFKIIVGVIAVIAVVILLIAILPPIDSTIMNWFIAIILILALLKR